MCHRVPQFRPQAALHMLKVVLAHGALAPNLVPNEQLGQMTDAQFDSFLDGWTTSAERAVL
jgi:hypothetical protein